MSRGPVRIQGSQIVERTYALSSGDNDRSQRRRRTTQAPVLRHLKAPPRPGAPAGLMVTCCRTKDRAGRDTCL